MALVLVLLFRKQRPYFAEHLVFALHPGGVPSVVHHRDLSDVRVLLNWVVEFGYLINASVRFYYPEQYGKKIGWSKSEWRPTLAIFLVVIANSIFSTFVDLVGAAVALWRL